MTAALRILLLLAGLGFPSAARAADEPLAVVDGAAIGSEEVEKSLAGQLSKLEEQIYNLQAPEARRAGDAAGSQFCFLFDVR